VEALAANKKYLTKVIQFNGLKMTLYSLDGQTWSSRKVELVNILERREQQRLALAGKTDETEAAGIIAGGPIKATEHDIDDNSDTQALVVDADADIELEALAQELDEAPVLPRSKQEKPIRAKSFQSLPKKPKVLKNKAKVIAKKIKLITKVSKPTKVKNTKVKEAKKKSKSPVKLVPAKKKAVKKASKPQKNSRKAA
jgi:hypothetical protein